MAWRMARSLDTLLGQLNARFPGRSKVSDGGIGDAAHATRDSDHNPWYVLNGMPLVTARDFTHDPRVMNGGWLADTLIAHNDPRIKYIIWNRRIWTPGAGWRAYSGSNPHDHHLHLSVDANPSADSTAPWAGINQLAPVPPKEIDVNLNDPMRDYIWPHTNEIKDTVGSTLANGMSYSKTSADTAARVEARLAAMDNKLTNNQVAVMAAIADNGVEVDLTTDQMQELLTGLTAGSKQALRELLGSLDNQ